MSVLTDMQPFFMSVGFYVYISIGTRYLDKQ